MDRDLYGQISELQDLVRAGDTLSALAHVQSLGNSLKERNRVCKISHGER
jgi:5-enolpyruvylshikimate-3-phosphate synthase